MYGRHPLLRTSFDAPVEAYKLALQQKSGNKKAEGEAGKDAEGKVKEIEAAGKKSGGKVVDDLIKAVTSPKPEVPDKFSKED